MPRASYLAGRTFDQLLRLTERASPKLAFRFKRHFYRPDMKFSLDLLRRSGLQASAVIDVGAYVGDWARECLEVFPDARVLMIEPSPARVERLRSLCSQDPRLSVVQTLLSSNDAGADFEEQESNSSITATPSANTVHLPTQTLDTLVADTEFAAAQLLKVDVQGHDLQVLMGGEKTLAAVEVLIVELSLIKLHPGAPALRTVIDWLDDRGFRLFDIASLIRRPVDDALWQIDAVFVRHGTQLGRADAGW